MPGWMLHEPTLIVYACPRRWARASGRLVVVCRLLCRTAADCVASEGEVARADVDVQRECLVEC